MDEHTFVKYNRSDESLEILKHPNEFALLGLISYRAKRTNSLSTLGLEVGEALIGDYKSCGLTEQKYRTAKKNLEKWGIITTKATNKGTIAKLINSDIFNINSELPNDQTNERVTDNQRTGNGQVTTNKNVKNDKNVKNEKNKDIVYPDWLNLELWKEFKKMRVKIKKPMTEHAESLAIPKLKKLIDSGENQDAVINQSIEFNWQAFYPGKRDNTKPRKQKEITPDNVNELYDN